MNLTWLPSFRAVFPASATGTCDFICTQTLLPSAAEKKLEIPPCVFENLLSGFASLRFSSTSNKVTGSPRHHFYLWFLLFLLFSQLFLAGPIRMAGLHTSPRLMRKEVLVCSSEIYFHSWHLPGVSLQMVRYIAHPKSG